MRTARVGRGGAGPLSHYGTAPVGRRRRPCCGGGFRGDTAPYVQAFAGYRAKLGPARLGFELNLDGFNRVDLLTDFGMPPLSCASTARHGAQFGVDLR